jgi:DNA-binding MarR family transcriptional regulator
LAGFGVLNRFVRFKPEGESPANMALAFQVTRGTITNTIGRLKGLGFVTIEADPHDGRGKIVRITQSGRICHKNCVESVAPHLSRLGQALDQDMIAVCLPYLAKLRQWMDEDRNATIT